MFQTHPDDEGPHRHATHLVPAHAGRRHHKEDHHCRLGHDTSRRARHDLSINKTMPAAAHLQLCPGEIALFRCVGCRTLLKRSRRRRTPADSCVVDGSIAGSDSYQGGVGFMVGGCLWVVDRQQQQQKPQISRRRLKIRRGRPANGYV